MHVDPSADSNSTTTMANSSRTPSLAQFPHVQPVPQGSAFFGPGNGTDYYIFNSSLPTEGSMVCTQDTEWRNLTFVCCAPSIGIRSQTGCRLGDTQENRDFYANCTHQIALESRSDDTADVNAQIDLKCTPFSEFLDKQRTDTASSLSSVGTRIQIATKKKIPICASVGFPDRFNFTGSAARRRAGRVMAGKALAAPRSTVTGKMARRV